MKLSSTQVKKVAKLANLIVLDEEVDKYATQLSEILEYIDLLDKVDTDNVDSTYNITALINITQEDNPGNSFTQEEALSNVSQKKNGLFITKGVFDE